METRLILHNTISLNGALNGFDANMGIHYGTAAKFRADAYIAGSGTVLQAGVEIPPEEEKDKRKPPVSPSDPRPWWLVVDSKGKLRDVLHFYRRMEYIRGIIVLVSAETPQDYLDYLDEREYDKVMTGSKYADYPVAFEKLREEFGIKTILSDSGSTLNNIFLSNDMADEISLVIAPCLAYSDDQAFRRLKLPGKRELKLIGAEELQGGHVWVRYEVEGKQNS